MAVRGKQLVWGAIALAIIATALLIGARLWTVHVLVERFMHPQRVPVGPADPNDHFQDVALKTSDGIELSGWFRPSSNGVTIVFVHGLAANRTQLLGEARILAGAGYGVLLIDLRAHGNSGGDRSTWGDREQQDLLAAVRWLQKTQPNDRIGAVGLSIGASTVAEVAAKEPAIAAVVLEGGSGTLYEDITRSLGRWAFFGSWLAQQKGMNVPSVRPIDRLTAISPRPILLVYGEHDEDPVLTPKHMLAAAGEPKTLVMVPKAPHGHYADTDPALMSQHLLALFARIRP